MSTDEAPIRKRSGVSQSSPSVSLTSTSMCSACLDVETPPAGFMPMTRPVRCVVAQRLEHHEHDAGRRASLALPVEVLMKSAPASMASIEAWRTWS